MLFSGRREKNDPVTGIGNFLASCNTMPKASLRDYHRSLCHSPILHIEHLRNFLFDFNVSVIRAVGENKTPIAEYTLF
jgi:hypothetical protein